MKENRPTQHQADGAPLRPEGKRREIWPFGFLQRKFWVKAAPQLMQIVKIELILWVIFVKKGAQYVYDLHGAPWGRSSHLHICDLKLEI